jgi:hypothetical protein
MVTANVIPLGRAAFAHGTTGAKYIKICNKKKSEALQYCDSNEFI